MMKLKSQNFWHDYLVGAVVLAAIALVTILFLQNAPAEHTAWLEDRRTTDRAGLLFNVCKEA